MFLNKEEIEMNVFSILKKCNLKPFIGKKEKIF